MEEHLKNDQPEDRVCFFCKKNVEIGAPSKKTILQRFPRLKNKEMPDALCLECYKKYKKIRRKALAREREIEKYKFDCVFKNGDYSEYMSLLKRLNDDIKKINQKIEKRMEQVKRYAKKQEKKIALIHYAYDLAEKTPQVLYPEARKEANKSLSDINLRLSVFKKHGRRCVYCNSDKDITIDHIIPVLLGGTNDVENLQPLCRSCNSKKGATVPHSCLLPRVHLVCASEVLGV